MIRHCVFINFKPEISQASRASMLAEIAALEGRLDGISAVHLGENVSPETGMDKGFSSGFIVDFVDAKSRDTYLSDADHQKIGAKLVASAVGGIAGILVYDIEV
jgi:Stress responsive A/B Barrel Domain